MNADTYTSLGSGGTEVGKVRTKIATTECARAERRLQDPHQHPGPGRRHLPHPHRAHSIPQPQLDSQNNRRRDIHRLYRYIAYDIFFLTILSNTGLKNSIFDSIC